MSRYALIGPDGKVHRVTPRSTHPAALPVVYPDLEQDKRTHDIRQRPASEWEVDEDRVVVTYAIEKKAFAPFAQKLQRQARDRHAEALESGVRVELSGKEFNIGTDDTSLARISQAAFDASVKPDGWEKHWRVAEGEWVAIGKDDIQAMHDAAAAHVEACFRRLEEIEIQLAGAETVEDLAEVDVRAGWPTG